MQLADLLAREGYSSRDVPALLSWAHARASVLLQTLDPDSTLGALLEGLPGHVVQDSPSSSRDSSRDSSYDSSYGGGSSYGVGSSSDDSDDLRLEQDEDGDLPADLRRAVTAATSQSQPITPTPAYVDDDPDSGLGGFARFQSILKLNRPYPYRRQEPVVDERPTR